MEFTFIFPWAVAALLGYGLWVRGKNHGLFQQALEQFLDRIRSGLGVVGIRELENIHEKFLRLEQQGHVRKVSVTPVEKFPHQFQACLEKGESLVYPHEPSHESFSVMDGPVSRPRSILWVGLRFTLSDSFWLQMKVVPKEDMEDDQVQAMVQGPFCRVCLKRLVVRDRLQVAVVPAQCQNCGWSWSMHDSEQPSMPVSDLKRMVYDMFNQNLRASRKFQC